MSRSLNDIIKRSGFGEKMGIKLKKEKKPIAETYTRAIVGKASGIKIENYSLKTTINEIINYKRGVGEDGPMSASALGDKVGSALKTIWEKIKEIFATIWKFISSHLSAFWNWITGKGKESTVAAVENAFYEASGGEVGERLALPAPNTTSNTSNNNNVKQLGMNIPTKNNVVKNDKEKIGYNQNSGNTNNTAKKTGVAFPKIFGDEQSHSQFNKLIVGVINDLESSTHALSSNKGELSSAKDLNSEESVEKIMNVINNTMGILMYGKSGMNLSSLQGATSAKEGNGVITSINNRLDSMNKLGEETVTMDKSNYVPFYNRWKKIRKYIDNICARMENYKDEVTRTLEELNKCLSRVLGGVHGQNTASDIGSYKSKHFAFDAPSNNGPLSGTDPKMASGALQNIANIASHCANQIKTEMTDISKKMKTLLDSIRPR